MLTKDQEERYSRQIISSNIGKEGQEKISKVRVLQVGAGGLGSPCALYLVAAGIKELTIIDNDVVDISNLQRQILYNETQVGKIKVKMAEKALTHLNSGVKVKAFKDYVDEGSIEKYVDGQDFIVDCSDNLETKFLVNRTALKHGMMSVIAGIEDFYGQITTVNPGKSACYECIFSMPGTERDSKRTLPVVGVTPGVLGSLEASEVIKTTLGLENLEDHLLMINLIKNTFTKVKVERHEKCYCNGFC